VPGLSTFTAATVVDQVQAFYQQANHSLITLGRIGTGKWGAPQNLGGVLTSGPAAIDAGYGTGQWVFARGTDQAVWYRRASGSGWTPVGLAGRQHDRRTRCDL
jgi:hypothetical protein